MGIAPDMLPCIFELFVQADRVLHQSQGGLVIGLTLVRGLVEMHGGSVAAHSEEPGKGSEFVVRLPAPNAKGTAEDAGAAPPRCLLVDDDNVDAAQSLALLLRMASQVVWVAYDGPAALEACPGALKTRLSREVGDVCSSE